MLLLLGAPIHFVLDNVARPQRDFDRFIDDNPSNVRSFGQFPKVCEDFLKTHGQQGGLRVLQERQHDAVRDLPALEQEAVPESVHQIETEGARVLRQQPLRREHGHVDRLPVQVIGQSGKKLVN